MENVIIQLSRYVLVFFFAIYTLYCFVAFRGDKETQKRRQKAGFFVQRVLLFLIHLLASMILYMVTGNEKVLGIYVTQVVFLLVTIKLYQWVYKGLSRLVLNNMMMLLVVSFVMLERLDFENATRQFVIIAVIIVLSLFVPFLVERMSYLERFGWFYGAAGLACLLLVLVLGKEKYGAKNWIIIGGMSFQPSEFVKLLFVFFLASMLAKDSSFRNILHVGILSAAYVLVLVVEKDLGGALIYFITFLIMIYVASGHATYLFTGLVGGSAASIVAYHLFSHVRVRVQAWSDPWSVIDNKGYQIAQSLFAIGTGSWFGLGLAQGLPRTIPVVTSDFIFSAICEELGGLFGICLILVYINCFLLFVNIAMKMKRQFYKLSALGLSILYVFQVFLSIGGVTKLIPSTGVTLPLISYGGSSAMSTILLFGIIQGMYVRNERERERERAQGLEAEHE